MSENLLTFMTLVIGLMEEQMLSPRFLLVHVHGCLTAQ